MQNQSGFPLLVLKLLSVTRHPKLSHTESADLTHRACGLNFCHRLQATVEHVSQAALFLEDAGDLSQALNRDVDEMSMDEQVSLKLLKISGRSASTRTISSPFGMSRAHYILASASIGHICDIVSSTER